VAGGGYLANDGTTYPLIATSGDSGSSWAYTLDANGPTPSNLFSGFFNGVSCSGSHCVAAGEYQTSAHQYLMIATSTNSGGSWTYTLDGSSNPPAGGDNGGAFKAVNCSGSICVAGGSYITNVATNYPVIASSIDGGSLWTYTLDSSTSLPLPSDYNGNGSFFAVTCSGQICVAGGQYQNNTGITYPLIASSKNGGGSWTYSFDSSTSPLPSGFFSNGVFEGTSIQ
jgi:hypothetical protein